MTPEQDAVADNDHAVEPRSNALFDALWAIAVRLNREDEERNPRDKPPAFDTVEDITNA